MMNLNKVQLIGRLGRDPELRHANSIPVVSFSMATSEVSIKDGNRREFTDWHNIVAWRNLAENMNNLLKKGKLVYIEGKLRSREYTDKEGVKKYITEVVADNFILLERREDNGEQSGQRENYNANVQNPVEAQESNIPAASQEDDLPF